MPSSHESGTGLRCCGPEQTGRVVLELSRDGSVAVEASGLLLSAWEGSFRRVGRFLSLNESYLPRRARGPSQLRSAGGKIVLRLFPAGFYYTTVVNKTLGLAGLLCHRGRQD